MPTFKQAAPELLKAVEAAGGTIRQVGTKPWAFFLGADASERGQAVEHAYALRYGYRPSFAGRPWREDQLGDWDYAVRLD